MPNSSSKPSLVRPRAPPTPALLISTCSGSSRARNSAAQLRAEARSARSSGRDRTASFPVAAVVSAAAARPLPAARQATQTLTTRPGPAAAAAPLRPARRGWMWTILGVVAGLRVGVNAYAAYVRTSENSATAGATLRPSGIPRNISPSLANLMQLSPVPGALAPGFTLTDQRGHTMSLASLRGKAVVLEFMDPHCTDICPIV